MRHHRWECSAPTERKMQLFRVMQYLIEGQFQLPLFLEEDEDMNKKADSIERRMQKLVSPVLELVEMHDLKYGPEELKERIRQNRTNLQAIKSSGGCGRGKNE